jgi:hypothetical protein
VLSHLFGSHTKTGDRLPRPHDLKKVHVQR